jgi:hypothetical protein
MALNLLTNAQGNLAIDAIFPSGTRQRTVTASAPNSITHGDVAGIVVGSVVTCTGLSGTVIVSAVTESTGVVTTTGGSGTATVTDVATYTLTISGSLHTGSPGQNGANEVAGGSYGRQGVTLAYPSSTPGTEPTTNAQNWTGMPSATVTYFGLNAAATGTTYYLGGGQLTSSLTVPSGATVAAAIGALTVAITA